MTTPDLPARVKEFIEQYAHGETSMVIALYALVTTAGPSGEVVFNDFAVCYRDDYLKVVASEGRDVERESGRLGLDEVRQHLAGSVLPRLAADGLIVIPPGALKDPDSRFRIASEYWNRLLTLRGQFQSSGVAEAVRSTGTHAVVEASSGPRRVPRSGKLSVLEARGLVKTYRRRKVVNDVALRLQQGEIVGLLGPNGAGKTTTFYMIVGLIQPQEGRILLDREDITEMPMYQRARRGIGYLSQEPSIFRKLTVEENLLAILETLPLSREQRRARLETLLDELGIKRLRQSKAYALSGGERRRLEITRALVTEP
jgi:lipopolysaccharide export system ATP-binding protein